MKKDQEVLEGLASIIADCGSRSLNEADTRYRVINYVLHDVLAWPRNRTSTEDYIAPGYADYVLRRLDGTPLILIEAKKEGAYFELPAAVIDGETSAYISIGKLLTDEVTKAAMQQVRRYCQDVGCEFAAITNGHEWVFFKTFEKGKKWESLQAFVARSLDFFNREYTRAYNSLSYSAIVDRLSLPGLLTSSPPRDRSIHYAKDRIPSYSHSITANRLASVIRPVVNYYFGVISDNDTEFMDRCYVAHRDYQTAFDGMRTLIEDSLSPHFRNYRIQQLENTGKGGQLGGRITKNIKKGRSGEVLVLFGGKGSGKSTFIKRLLHHNPPRWLRDHAVIAIVDLLRVPEDLERIETTIWGGLVSQLDTHSLLSSDRSVLLDKLFRDRFEVATKQELSGLSKASEAYNTKLNELVAAWKSDHRYCARRLMEYWKVQDVGLIAVIDNTDQYSGVIQDYCFTSAQEIADELKCVTLISMREERFHNSKIHGLLDAFQNAGFHISSPRPAEVFRKRLDYVGTLLSSARKREELVAGVDADLVDDCVKYLLMISREFHGDISPLNGFLTACAHGDIRLSLDLFRSFLLSGYTNVDEMLAAGSWNLQIHQVIKPVMIPERYYYDELLSDIPNIYQLRDNRHSSHFTSLRILRRLSRQVDSGAASYLSIAELKAYFAETFNMLDDFARNMDILLKHGFVEADNRLDSFSEAVDSVKVTGYGHYMFGELAFLFPYIDLICTDSGVYEETVSNYLVAAAKTEYGQFIRNERIKRVETRLKRVGEFIGYLEREEREERRFFGLQFPDEELFTYKCRVTFDKERERVLASAQKQARKAKGALRRGRARGPTRYRKKGP